MAARTFRKKKQQQSRVFFGVIFYVYTNVDNRERARASYWKFVGRKTWKFKAAMRKWEMLAAVKIKANMNTGNKILGKHIQQFLHKNNV